MSKKLKFLWSAFLLALALPGALLAADQEEESDDGIRNCIRTTRIDRTKVVDDLNILFYMRGRTIYHVRLPRRCPGLRREGRFTYRTTSGSLCHLDSITVLYSSATGLDPGPSCRLGYFQEITEEDAEGIIEGLQQPTEAEPLPPAEPEDVTGKPKES